MALVPSQLLSLLHSSPPLQLSEPHALSPVQVTSQEQLLLQLTLLQALFSCPVEFVQVTVQGIALEQTTLPQACASTVSVEQITLQGTLFGQLAVVHGSDSVQVMLHVPLRSHVPLF